MDYEFGEAIRLADTMSPRSVAVAVAELVREMGVVPLRVLEGAMLAAGYDGCDVRAVWAMCWDAAGIEAVQGDLVWVGGAA